MFSVPLGRLVVAIASAAACAMVRLRVAEVLIVGDSESVTVTLTENVPTSSVVPEMVALGVPELKLSPEGKPVAVHV